jgi:hypothetical protein
MPASDRDKAIELFIQNVRLGNQAQARVAMAGLAIMTGEGIPVGDRPSGLDVRTDRRARTAGCDPCSVS